MQLTGAEFAAQAEISPGMLSKIETAVISPSLSTLQSLARALNVPMTSFFADFEERRGCSYVKAGQGLRIERRGTKAGHVYELIGHTLSGDVAVEPYLIKLNTDAEPYTLFHHDGVELIYMISGKVTYRHAEKSYLLEPGDALFFECDPPRAGNLARDADFVPLVHRLSASLNCDRTIRFSFLLGVHASQPADAITTHWRKPSQKRRIARLWPFRTLTPTLVSFGLED